MRNCSKCGTAWERFGQPRPRQVCVGCGAYLHSCVNCQHFDRTLSNSCRLKNTAYIGPRDAQNYCDEYRMANARLQAIEARTQRARNVWEELFRK